MKKKCAETEVYLIDFINKSKVRKIILDNSKPNKKLQEQIFNAVEMLVSIKSARQIPMIEEYEAEMNRRAVDQDENPKVS